MKQLSTLAREHEHQLTAGLSPQQHKALQESLQAIADQQNLPPAYIPATSHSNQHPSAIPAKPRNQPAPLPN